MKNALLILFGAVLLVTHVSAQSSAASEVNRILGARLNVEYNDDKTAAIVHVTNISSKIISTVRISYKFENDAESRSMSSGNLKPGESIMEGISGARLAEIHLDAIIYADGTQEVRNDAVLAALNEEERQIKERQEKEKQYASAFAAPNPSSHMPVEEQIVRDYYAKLTFISQLQILSSVIMHSSPKLTEAAARDLMKDQIHVDLSEFQTGDFAEIETRPWTLLLNPDAPQGVIDVNSVGAQYWRQSA